MMKLSVCGVAAAVGLAACGPTYSITDDIDLTFDFGPTLSSFHDDLHSPYVRGAKVTIFANSSDDHPSFVGWSIVSMDPSVFRIDVTTEDDSGTQLVAHGQAVGVGTAELRLLDEGGTEVGHGVAEVALPDRIELDAQASLILGRDDEAAVGEARVVEGGEATYLVRYFSGGRELHGNGVLGAQASSGLATPRTTFLFENREWLSLDTTVVGAGELQLSADQVMVSSVPVVVVGDDAIADVVVLTQSEDGHNEGDWLVAVAQAYDSAGQRIFGVDYAWDVDGAAQDAEGDIYRYRFKPGSHQLVRATRGVHSDAAEIQSDMGFVSSTNVVGCTTGGGAGLLVAVAGLGLVIVRRRRHG